MSCRRICATLFGLSLVAAAPRAEAYRYSHEVLPGESLLEIAHYYRISVAQLKRLNRMRRSFLRAGRKLKIVTAVPTRQLRKIPYRVHRGDSLSRIAARHKMKLVRLRMLNRKAAQGTLRIGQKLWVVVQGPMPGGGVKGLYQLGNGPGYRVRWKHRSWGTLETLTGIQDVFGDYSQRYPKAKPITIWDVSKKGGGKLAKHMSHRSGRDVDIPYVQQRKYERVIKARPETLNLSHTWYLLKRFVRTRDVTFIFMDYKLQKALQSYAKRIGEKKKLLDLFQYPRGKNAHHGIIRHEPGHSTHYHVRFRRSSKPKMPII